MDVLGRWPRPDAAAPAILPWSCVGSRDAITAIRAEYRNSPRWGDRGGPGDDDGRCRSDVVIGATVADGLVAPLAPSVLGAAATRLRTIGA
jgi:hypothetical protein